MNASIATAVSHALPARLGQSQVELGDLQHELDRIAEDALAARQMGIELHEAVTDPRFEALVAFHRDLRDAMFVEIPRELETWIEGIAAPAGSATLANFGGTLTRLARDVELDDSTQVDLQQALAELLLFEAVRLRLLLVCWQTEEFERLGGEEADIDLIAWSEVTAMLAFPEVDAPHVRPLQLMIASASVSLAREAAQRAGDLHQTGGDLRERLSMRARLRAALRELRLPESVLLENALSTLLGEERLELAELQALHPIALAGLSRQAMDQRVSRGRRALTGGPSSWPRRRRPALFDLLR